MNTVREKIEEIALKFGCSPEQVRAQFARNAKGLREMQAKAAMTGRKVGNYTAVQLKAMAEAAEKRAQL